MFSLNNYIDLQPVEIRNHPFSKFHENSEFDRVICQHIISKQIQAQRLTDVSMLVS